MTIHLQVKGFDIPSKKHNHPFPGYFISHPPLTPAPRWIPYFHTGRRFNFTFCRYLRYYITRWNHCHAASSARTTTLINKKSRARNILARLFKMYFYIWRQFIKIFFIRWYSSSDNSPWANFRLRSSKESLASLLDLFLENSARNVKTTIYIIVTSIMTFINIPTKPYWKGGPKLQFHIIFLFNFNDANTRKSPGVLASH